MFKGKKILILEGYARQCLPFMRSFKNQGCEVTLLCGSKLDVGYASRLPDHKIVGVCDPHKYAESEAYICNLIKNGNYDLVVPLVDFSARILSENKAELSKYAVIASNDFNAFDASQDKLSVMKICMENGIPCPLTLDGVSSVASVLESKLKFPMVVKPRRGCGARGFNRFDTVNDFVSVADNIDLSESVVQEYIPQTDRNLSANLFIGEDGELKCAFVYRSLRWYPLKGGTGTFNGIVERPDIIKSSYDLVSLLGLRGWVGVDLIDDLRDGTAKVIEVNPRILACAQIGFDVGIDMGLMLLQYSFGKDVEEQSPKKSEAYVRMSQTDILWFLKSPDRFKASPSWFSLKNTKDQTFRFDDPLPWFAFLLRGLFNYKKEMDER